VGLVFYVTSEGLAVVDRMGGGINVVAPVVGVRGINEPKW
jgi:hypothetical protein